MATWIDRTQTAGNQKTFTISAWVKRTGNLSQYNHLFTTTPNPGNWCSLRFTNSDTLALKLNNDTAGLITDRVFRDTNGWFHIVATVDTTQATASDRMKLYVNGVQETSFSTETYPSQNADTTFNQNSQTLRIGHNTWSTGGPEYFDGLMSHVHFIDGTAYAASAFGSTDSTTGQWKITTSPSVTYGTNGFFLFKDNASVNDQSGNGNNFSVSSGTLTQTEDNPSNVLPTFGSGTIIPNNSTNSFLRGGLTLVNSTAIWQSETVPFAFSSGKYYWEVKLHHNGGDPRIGLGVMNNSNFNINSSGNNVFFRNQTGGYGFHSGGSSGDYVYANGSSIGGTQTSNFDAIDGTICGIAVDCDNKRMYLSVNGTWENSANPSNGTNPYDVSSGWTTGDLMFPFITTHNSNVDFNFGNGYFGTNAIASEGTNASGIGKFEYDVPTGFTALCTKGLNE